MDSDGKIVDGEQMVKARLVAKGFQERNEDRLRTNSLTCTKEIYVVCYFCSNEFLARKITGNQECIFTEKRNRTESVCKNSCRGHKR